MADQLDHGRDFAVLLRREVERILADPAFRRAPVQSRLLAYLCERTVAHPDGITQRAVAVDALGRADPRSESYPRVQISRLRRNLALYYAREAPGEGLAVAIRRGDYRLRLASPGSAYSSEHRDRSRAALFAAALLALLALAGLWLVWR